MTLLLMAAGSGSRYGKLKQFDDLGPAGEFLMEFSIFDALKNGFNHIVVITKQENQEFLQIFPTFFHVHVPNKTVHRGKWVPEN